MSINRRNFINLSSLGIAGITLQGFANKSREKGIKPIVIATWDDRIRNSNGT